MMSRTRGLIEIHLAVILFGMAGLFGKLLILPPAVIVLGRVFFASASLAVIMRMFGQSLKMYDWRDYLVAALGGLILAVHWIAFFEAIQVSTVAVALLTFSTFPVFATFLEPIFFRERLRLSDIGVALLALAGVALVVPEFTLSNRIALGALWGTLSGFTFALLALVNRKLVERSTGLAIAFYEDATAMILLFPFLFISRPVFETGYIWMLLFLGLICTGAAHSLFIRGLQAVKARTASIIACLEPVYGIILAAAILREMPTARTVAGGVVILAAALISTIHSASSNRREVTA